MDRGPDMSVLHTNPRRFARIAGAFYLLVFVLGIAALNTAGERWRAQSTQRKA